MLQLSPCLGSSTSKNPASPFTGEHLGCHDSIIARSYRGIACDIAYFLPLPRRIPARIVAFSVLSRYCDRIIDLDPRHRPSDQLNYGLHFFAHVLYSYLGRMIFEMYHK